MNRTINKKFKLMSFSNFCSTSYVLFLFQVINATYSERCLTGDTSLKVFRKATISTFWGGLSDTCSRLSAADLRDWMKAPMSTVAPGRSAGTVGTDRTGSELGWGSLVWDKRLDPSGSLGKGNSLTC